MPSIYNLSDVKIISCTVTTNSSFKITSHEFTWVK